MTAASTGRPEPGGFDFAAFRSAFEACDVAAWSSFYAADAEWLEYKHSYPPSSPRRIAGRGAITEFLGRIREAGVTLEISDEVVGPERAAFCLWCTLADGRRIIEHVIVHFRGGRIARQVDVEAWDPAPDPLQSQEPGR